MRLISRQPTKEKEVSKNLVPRDHCCAPSNAPHYFLGLPPEEPPPAPRPFPPPPPPRLPPSPLPPLREDGAEVALDPWTEKPSTDLGFESFALDSIRGVDVGAVEEELVALLLLLLPLLEELERPLDPSADTFAGVGAAAPPPPPAAAALAANDALYAADITLTPVPVPAPVPADVAFGAPRGEGDGREDEDEDEDALEADEEPLLGVDPDDGGGAAFDDALDDADAAAFAAAAVVADPAPLPDDDFETLRLPPPRWADEPSAAARWLSRTLFAPRSFRKSSSAFCGLGSSLPSDSLISA